MAVFGTEDADLWEQSKSKESICMRRKTIIVSSESIKPTPFEMNIPYLAADRLLLFSEPFTIIAQKLGIGRARLFSFDQASGYSNFLGCFPFENTIRLNYENYQQDVIHVRIEELCPQRDQKPQKTTTRVQRGQERTIGEVLEKVRLWRSVHESASGKGSKMTLGEAAKRVDIPRKTLDDYYQIIRIAEQKGFNFDRHKHEKMGLLRAFVSGRLELRQLQSRIEIQENANPECDNAASQTQACNKSLRMSSRGSVSSDEDELWADRTWLQEEVISSSLDDPFYFF